MKAGDQIKNLGSKFLVPFSRVAKNLVPILCTVLGRT